MTTLHLKPDRHQRIRSGHLWAFAGEIAEDLKPFTPGQAVALCDARGRLLGRGYVNPHSLIAIRLLTRGDETWDDALIYNRIQAAASYRDRFCPQWEARRLVYAESDGLPGLIVDQFGGHLVVMPSTAGIELRLGEIISALRELVNPQSILLKGIGHFRRLEGLEDVQKDLHGNTPDEIPFAEDDLTYTAHPKSGQKSGFYLDQRLNRGLLAGMVGGKKVLDLYCCTGAWGLTALKYGARSAVMVDSSQSATQWAATDAARNGFGSRAELVCADAAEFLRESSTRGDRYDAVIVDPPALITSRAALKQGIKAYYTINRAALEVVAPGGLLVSCSCSHLMSREVHLATVGEAAARAGRRIRLAMSGGHSSDHPILPGHPETEYLKCWVVFSE